MVKGCGTSFQSNESNLGLIVVIDTLLCEYTKSHYILHFKWKNYMECELHFNKPQNNIRILYDFSPSFSHKFRETTNKVYVL